MGRDGCAGRAVWGELWGMSCMEWDVWGGMCGVSRASRPAPSLRLPWASKRLKLWLCPPWALHGAELGSQEASLNENGLAPRGWVELPCLAQRGSLELTVAKHPDWGMCLAGLGAGGSSCLG